MRIYCHLIIAVFLGVAGLSHTSNAQYYGKLIGSFIQRGDGPDAHHNVAGTVYAVDDDTLQIIGFTYDGMGPDAFFWIGTGSSPSSSGTEVPKALGRGGEKLGAYSNEDLVIHLTNSAKISEFTWFSVWCKLATANFADVSIPADFEPPSQYNLGRLGFARPVHDVTASSVVILNSKQIQFNDLTYDGGGPDAYFWLDTRANPTSSGIRVPQVGETVASRLTQRLSGVTKTVQLPSGYDVFNIATIGLWCVLARQDFGHVDIPQDLETRQNIIPFSVAEDTEPDVMTTAQNVPQTGRGPTTSVPSEDVRNTTNYTPKTTQANTTSAQTAYDNCEVLLDDELQVSWTIDGSEIAIRLSSRQPSGMYMSFGPSGSDSRTDMIGSDVAVAWIDQETSQARVDDYYLESRQQCIRSTGQGACPDTDRGSSSTNDILAPDSFYQDGITHISYRRPLAATDANDKAISTSGPQYISWALGPINSDNLATYHTHRTQGNKQINFGRASSSCPSFTVRTGSDGETAFQVPPIEALEETTFRCDIGEAGGPRGYQGITGTIGWGIAWYINGNLIPEITVRRNVTYTFEVYGGNNPNQSASYHPFYITDNNAGGYSQVSEAERSRHQIYAGPVDGPLCYYDDTPTTPLDMSYREYRDSLQFACPDGNAGGPGRFTWTPNADTPDLVYYQCYTHRYLGWKIHVTGDANVCILSMVVMVTSLLVTIFMN